MANRLTEGAGLNSLPAPLILALSVIALLVASSFKRLELKAGWLGGPIIAGALSGGLITFVYGMHPRESLWAGAVLLFIVNLMLRRGSNEVDPVDGLVIGAMAGAVASLPLVLFSSAAPFLLMASTVLTGATSGYGVVRGASRSGERRWINDTLTLAAAIFAAAAPQLLVQRLTESEVLWVAALAAPVIVVVAVFVRWPAMRRELLDEARQNLMDPNEVSRAAHPILRLTRSGWTDRLARRHFVKLATDLANLKRQQRTMAPEVARLYHLEVLRLRTELREIVSIHDSLRAALSRQPAVEGDPSDRIDSKGWDSEQ